MLSQLKRLSVHLALAGVLLLVAALTLYLLTQELDLRAEVLLGLGVVLLVLSAVSRPDLWRSALTGRTATYGSSFAISIVAFFGILALLNFLADRHHRRWDLTETREYTLSPQTLQILSGLTEPVEIKAFFPPNYPGQQQFEDLLTEYSYHTDKISYQVVDPDVQPFVAQQYEITSYGTIVFESAGRRQEIFMIDEQEVTGAILKVSRETQKVVYFLTGHGERDSSGYDQSGYSEVRDALERDNYVVGTLNLAISSTVPADTSVLIVAAPRTPLMEQERQAIEAFLNGGGKALFMQEPGEQTDLDDVLAAWGVDYGEDVIVDPERALFGLDPLSPVVDSFSFSEITRDLPSVVIGTARSVTRTIEQPDNLSPSTLVESSAGSWGETDFEALRRQEAQYDAAEDRAGPLAMVVTVESQGEGEEVVGTRLVVCGDSDFAANVNVTLGGNLDLFLNSVNWLAEEEELISIRPTPPADRRLILSPGQARFLQYSSVIFLPAAVLLVGAVIWWRRR